MLRTPRSHLTPTLVTLVQNIIAEDLTLLTLLATKYQPGDAMKALVQVRPHLKYRATGGGNQSELSRHRCGEVWHIALVQVGTYCLSRSG